jgi:hypothetical protein
MAVLKLPVVLLDSALSPLAVFPTPIVFQMFYLRAHRLIASPVSPAAP